MNEIIPEQKDYKSPIEKRQLLCYSCNAFSENIREIKEGYRVLVKPKFWWICPDCFKKLDLKEKEKVKFD